ncbi:acyltransferase [Azomonas macrocytogenes]|uniref:1-acyl-sn-glycerol-3-phosphate acyltransferase n=1 Tax=Azomonas macrocytogenes TaxID=69962 RepID=A0A839T2X8_AZOMA|nr:acyltransferase [Azomonas macrocytogenes]MBB3102724.1 1-acyl-sn-glycerol-3-phosphate acyltransferase [Azomonas macrocytogenes]
MRHLVIGITTSVLLLFNTLLAFVPILLLGLLKLLPWRPLQDCCSRGITWLAEAWAAINNRGLDFFVPTVWDIRNPGNLRRDASYLIISNHQSWVDIPALMRVFNRKTPYFKFFLKKELIWVPLLGLAFWALDYPFMKRYSKAFLEKHPHMQGKDLEITRRACEKFRNQPVAVVNYLEGTRFTAAKHAQQNSPYRHLLKPKAGGVAFVFGILGKQLDSILDVTVVYPDERVPGFWELLSGQVQRVIIDIQPRELDPRLAGGDYQSDPDFRRAVQDWVSHLWQEKDARIERLRRENPSR